MKVKYCKICGNPLNGRNKYYCSFKCFRKRITIFTDVKYNSTSLIVNKIASYIERQMIRGRKSIELNELIDVARGYSTADHVAIVLEAIADLGLEWRLKD